MRIRLNWLVLGGITITFVFLFPIVTESLDCALKNGVYMSLDKASYTVEEKPILTIKNCGPNEITFGIEYKMEKFIDEEWVEVSALNLDVPWAWPAALRILPPGRSFRQSIDLIGLEPGDYRVVKTVRDEATERSRIFRVKFVVMS
jgi:hypothetical protein